MADLGVIWKNGFADLAIIDGDLHGGSELETNILVSLFTDGRSQDVTKVDKRGHWSDIANSRLWELFREPATIPNLQRAITYFKQSLQWFIDKGIAQSINVDGLIFNRNGYYIELEFIRGTNKKYDYLWNSLNNRTYDFEDNSIFIKYQV